MPLCVVTWIWPPLWLPSFASKLSVSTLSSAIESSVGTIAMPMFTSSCTLEPFTRKALAVSRWPLTESAPRSRLPEGGVLATPLITTAFGCAELTGTTPVVMASRSVKLRPFSGTFVNCFSLSVRPVCVSSGSIVAEPVLSTVIASEIRANWSRTTGSGSPPRTVARYGANPTTCTWTV